LQLLLPDLQPATLVRGAVLIETGAALTHAYFPESGITSLVIRLSKDRDRNGDGRSRQRYWRRGCIQ
jgi:hypothetical protein